MANQVIYSSEAVTVDVCNHALRGSRPVSDVVSGMASLDLDGDGGVAEVIRSDGR